MSELRAEAAALPWVRLLPRRRFGRVVDPVSPEAAALVDQRTALRLGILPFGVWAHGLLVACVTDPQPEALALLEDAAQRVAWLRTTEADLAAAVRRVLGGPLRFGQWAVRLRRATVGQVLAAVDGQRRSGGRIGDILVSSGAITSRDRAEILARQQGVPFVDLLAGDLPQRTDLFSLMPEAFWRRERAVPFAESGQRLYVAAEDPCAFRRVLARLERRSGREVRLFASGRRDVERMLERHYQGEYLRQSRDALAEVRPEDSAVRLLTGPQSVLGVVALLLLAVGLWRDTSAVLLGLSAAIQALYLGLLGFKLWLVRRPTRGIVERHVTDDEIRGMDARRLPTYTILVPLRDEAGVLGQLVAALSRLDYPQDRLDIKLLLEEDDRSTLAAALALRLPACVEIVVLPDAQPRTKPKACNYGLLHARGEFVVIYDAEDLPQPDQIKKAVAAFRTASSDVACVQAKLSYYNRMQNSLTRWFTSEYATWFDLLLPGLQAAGMPIPLGGTSNHLRVSALRQVGAWDPYNVTEDADLGIRLHKAGYRTLLINSDTYEEANAEFVNWVRQRSRWVKGYLQTWLVHMRHPVRLFTALGLRGFLGFQAMILGTPLTFILNPLLWLVTTAWFLTAAGAIQAMFPAWLYYTGMLSMLFGNFTFAYLNMIALARRGEWNLMESAATSPAYWMLMSIAAWKALLQLVTRPSHWEKTVHGLWRPGTVKVLDTGAQGLVD